MDQRPSSDVRNGRGMVAEETGRKHATEVHNAGDGYGHKKNGAR